MLKSYDTLHQNVHLGVLVGIASDCLEWLNAYVVQKLTVWWQKTTKRSRPKDLTSPQCVLRNTQGLVLFA